MTFLVRPMEESDLATVLSWRNAPDISRFMWTQHEISVDEHREWFARAIGEKGRHLLIFEAEGIASGFVQFSRAGPGGIADWGFYRAPSAPHGLGRAMGMAALEHAFGVLRLYKVCGRAVESNEMSRKFHLSNGFTQEGILRQQFYDGEKYNDVVIFGLLRSEWMSAMAPTNE